VFGPAFPKGKVLAPDGSCVTPLAASRRDMCFLQYPPRPDRVGWIYVTHGLSQGPSSGGRAPRVELALHWRERDSKAPITVLAQAARYIRERGHALDSGAVLSSRDIPDLAVFGLQHWLACMPDPTIPAHLDLSAAGKAKPKGRKAGARSRSSKAELGRIRFILLLGISDAELQCALRVNPSLADGRQVLLEALQGGGVFPVSDPQRTCLTRRSDFHRLWENAFRAVRERTANGG
jgi:hypothetical protein